MSYFWNAAPCITVISSYVFLFLLFTPYLIFSNTHWFAYQYLTLITTPRWFIAVFITGIACVIIFLVYENFLFDHALVLTIWFHCPSFRHVHKISKATVPSSCLCFDLSVNIEQLCSHWTDFHETWYLSIIRKSVIEIQVSLKFDKNNGYFTWRPAYIFDHILLRSS